MAEHEQTLVFEFLEILKRNPSVLSSVLQTAQASTNGQTGVLKSPRTSICNTSTHESENGATSTVESDLSMVKSYPSRVESDPSAEDLLARRRPKGKGSNSKAQQTFRVSHDQIIIRLKLKPKMSQLLEKVNDLWRLNELTFQIKNVGFRA